MGTRSILVTGAAGFIGAATVQRLLQRGDQVVDVDNLNDYYDPSLKLARLELNEASASSPYAWHFHMLDIANGDAMAEVFDFVRPSRVIHLAVQAGVRYLVENPSVYIQTNLVRMGNLLERCRHQQVEHLVYAPSSSVYGGNRLLPLSIYKAVNHPVIVYATTKRSSKPMAHTYSSLYGPPATSLRLFTVDGPRDRPGMRLILFAKSIISRKLINIFNNSEMKRVFTYTDNIAEEVARFPDKPTTPESKFDRLMPNAATSRAPHRIFITGTSNPAPLIDLNNQLEDSLHAKSS